MDWITSYLEETSASTSPEVFRLWGAISTVGAVLQRKVWLETRVAPVYPNLYILLIGPAASGKTESIRHAKRLLEMLDPDSEQGLYYTAPDNISRAAFNDAMDNAKCRPVFNGEPLEYNSLYVASRELGVLLGDGYTNDFIAILTDVYDGHGFSETKRTRNTYIKVDKPQASIIAGATPNYLSELLPEGAWEQGFMSRCIVIFRNHKPVLSGMFQKARQPDFADLAHKLERIGSMHGEYAIEAGYSAAFEEWTEAGCLPTLKHPKLQTYNDRRFFNLFKLSMIAAASESSELVLTDAHFHRAKGWLLEAEATMEEVFKAMRAAGSIAEIASACFHFVMQEGYRTNKPVLKQQVIAWLMEQLPSYEVERTYELMCKGGMFVNHGGEFDKILANPNVRPPQG